jgi:hypothetical protein
MRPLPSFLTPLCAILLFTVVAPLLRAQDEGEEFQGRRRIEEWRRMKLIEAVDLNEEQSIRYFARENEFRKAERRLGEDRRAVLDRLRSLGKGNPADAEVQKELDALAAIGTRLVQLRVEFVNALRDLLSPKQIVRLLLFEDEFSRQLRSLLRESHNRGPRR